MANKKISDFTNKPTPSGGDKFLIEDSAGNYFYVTEAQLSSLIGAGFELISNKSTDVNADQASNTKYPSVKAVFDWVTGLFVKKGTITSNTILKGSGTDTATNSSITDDGSAVDVASNSFNAPSIYGDYTTGEIYAGSGVTIKRIRAFDGNASIITGSRLLAVANDKIELRHDVLNEFNAPDNNVNGNFQSTAPNGNFMYNIPSATGYEFSDTVAGEVNTNNTRTRVAHDLLIELNAASVKKNNQEIATQTYVDGLVAGLLDDRGSYDASSNLFPSTGGSGTAGAILKGDIWYISVAGTLGGSTVTVGDSVRALVDTPGQTSTNWSILETNIGYVPENVANKTGTVGGNESSTSLYLHVKGYYDYLVGLVWLTAQIWGTWINGLTSKTTPVDADQVVLMDSADTNKSKKLSWANLKTSLVNPFVDISASCTIVGWSSFTTKSIRAVDMGDYYRITGFITGTSDSTTTTVQLPYTNNGHRQADCNYGVNNGTSTFTRVIINGSSDTIDFRINAGGSLFAATGTKEVNFDLIIEK